MLNSERIPSYPVKPMTPAQCTAVRKMKLERENVRAWKEWKRQNNDR